ncbi:LORF2 protein, partial [Crocuta crocuta]
NIQMANRCKKRRLTSLIVKETQIETTMRHHLTPVRMAKIKKARNNTLVRMWTKRSPSILLVTMKGMNKKLTIELPYDPAVALPGIYPRDVGMLMHRGTWTPMFIAALSTIAKTWKEPKYPSADEWIKKMWFIYMMDYYMAMRRNEIWPWVATWMELEGVMLSE